ncbi:MAG: hypothetical protein IT373_33030, partial [Polyangiaceae bacterium]|nr:hypothetical protein [Polyangiaceae bacterium]
MSEPIQPVSERPRRGYRAAPARGGPGVDDESERVHGAAAALGPFAPGAYAEPEPTSSEPALGDLQRDLRAIRIQVARAALHPGELRDEL